MHHAKTRVKGESRINKRRFSINLNRHSSRCSFTSVCIILNFDNLNETRSKMNHYIYEEYFQSIVYISEKNSRRTVLFLIGAWWKVEGILNEKDENESWRILSEGWILLCIRFIRLIVPRITLFSPLTLASSSFRHSVRNVSTFVPRSTTRNQPSNTIESKEKRNENPRFTYSSPRGSINSNESRNGNRRGRIDRGELRFGRTVGP